jgi:hypothetical protein
MIYLLFFSISELYGPKGSSISRDQLCLLLIEEPHGQQSRKFFYKNENKKLLDPTLILSDL